jgi:hypothetical protein
MVKNLRTALRGPEEVEGGGTSDGCDMGNYKIAIFMFY